MLARIAILWQLLFSFFVTVMYFNWQTGVFYLCKKENAQGRLYAGLYESCNE